MTGSTASLDTLLEIQGDLVLVHQRDTEHLLTLVHVVDTGTRSLRLVNRGSRTGKPDWPVSDRLLAALRPAPPNDLKAKWTVTVK